MAFVSSLLGAIILRRDQPNAKFIRKLFVRGNLLHSKVLIRKIFQKNFVHVLVFLRSFGYKARERARRRTLNEVIFGNSSLNYCETFSSIPRSLRLFQY